MKVLRLKVKPDANKKQILLFTSAGIYVYTIAREPVKDNTHKKPNK